MNLIQPILSGKWMFVSGYLHGLKNIILAEKLYIHVFTTPSAILRTITH